MSKYNVTVNRTRTIEYSVGIEVSAKNKEVAQAKVQDRVEHARATVLDDQWVLNWDINSDDDELEYEVKEVE